MSKRNLVVFLLIFFISFLVLPQICLAEIVPKEIENYLILPKRDTEFIFATLIQELSDKWIEVTSAPYLDTQKQAILVMIKGGVQVKALNYAIFQLPKEVGVDLVKVIYKIAVFIYSPNKTAFLLKEFEKFTVEEAKKYAMEWLLQKETKISTGNLELSYPSYRGGYRNVVFPYIVAFHPLDSKRAKVGIEIYSSRSIDPPLPSPQYPWEGGIDKISPFILRIIGKIEKTKLSSYRWIEGPTIQIEFPDYVPEFEFREPSFIDKINQEIKAKERALKKSFEIAKDVGKEIIKGGKVLAKGIKDVAISLFNKVKSTIEKYNPFGAQMGPLLEKKPESTEVGPLSVSAPSSSSPIESEKSPTTTKKEEISEKKLPEREKAPSEPKLLQGFSEKPKLELAQLQEQIDDIGEGIDVISQKIAELLAASGKKAVLGKTTKEEIAEEEIVKEELMEEELKEEKVEEKLEEEQLKKEEEFKQDEEFKQKEKTSEVVLCQKEGIGAPKRNRVIINEVAWMGTKNSSNDEWIELKNISQEAVDLSGWQLLDKENQIKVIFDVGEVIPNNGFFLLERTDDNSVPDQKADLIYTGGLKNSDEALYLFDKNCQLQDVVKANPNWPAGDNKTKRTMERKSDFSWQSSASPGGTPKSKNSKGYVKPRAGGAAAPPAPPSYPKILISEIQIAPIEERFIELYNPNDQNIDLTGWYIQRKTQTSTSWNSLVSSTKFEGKRIQPKGHFLIAKSSSQNPDLLLEDLILTENNVILLKNPNREIVDKLGWGQAKDYEESPAQNPPVGKSIGRKWSTTQYLDTDNNEKDFEIQTPTPKEKNQSPTLPIDTTPPLRSNPQPTGTLSSGTNQINISLETDEPATCKYSTTSGIDYDSMTSLFSITGGTSHLTLITNLEDGNTYSFYVRCLDVAGNKNNDDFIITFSIASAPLQTIVINEIAWMGTGASWSDEWIELYNASSSEIDIANWSIYGANTGECLNFSEAKGWETTVIPAGGYLLYANKKESVLDAFGQSIVDIWDETIAMNNTAPGQLILYSAPNCEGPIVDIVNQKSGDWFSGINKNFGTKEDPKWVRASMERIDSSLSGQEASNWAPNDGVKVSGFDSQGKAIQGTPKAQNSASQFSGKTQVPDNTFISGNILWQKAKSPYLIEGKINVSSGSTLFIEPGVIIKLYPSANAFFDFYGKIEAVGTTSEKIVFTSLRDDEYGGETRRKEDFDTEGNPIPPAPGDWRNLYFREGSEGSRLEYVLVRYGGYSDYNFPGGNAAVVVNSAKIFIENSRFEKNKQRAIWLVNSNTLIEKSEFVENGARYSSAAVYVQENSAPEIKNSLFQNNKDYGIWFNWKGNSGLVENNFFEGQSQAAILVGKGNWPLIRGNQGQGNGINGILIFGGPYPEEVQNVVLENNALPYIIQRELKIYQGENWEIKPGVVIKFGLEYQTGHSSEWFLDKSGHLIVEGHLTALGEKEKPIVFTSLLDDQFGGDTNNDQGEREPAPGDWQNIEISGSAQLGWLKIRYAGAGGNTPLVIKEGAEVEKDDSTIFIEEALTFQP